MNAEAAIELSIKSKKDKYLRYIEEAAKEGRFSVMVSDGDELMKYRSFLEALGYKVRLLSEFDDDGRRWPVPSGAISWGLDIDKAGE